VDARIAADASTSSGNSARTASEALAGDPHSANGGAGSGITTAALINEFQTDGKGLAFRISTQAQIKSRCTSSLPPGNACPESAFQYNVAPSPSAPADAAPMAINLTSDFVVTSLSGGEACDTCLDGATAKGDLNSGYTLDYDGTKTADDSDGKRSWHVTLKGKIAILGPA
jgi:hypothetical protein